MSLAYFINQDCLHLAEIYRKNFVPSAFSEFPRISLGVFSICAETDKRAEELASSAALWRNNSQVGKFSAFPTMEESRSQINAESDNRTFVGSPSLVKDKLKPLLDKVVPEELKIITICESFSARQESYQLINDTFNS
jgi:alkanesulfonate monooxygenase SsuD/methylene tetrahydromethanopterin reductase-like flavin-dependent oxidoreductase (luciferase family)